MKHLIDKYRKVPITVKASIYYTVCNIIQKAIAFVTVPIFTQLLTTDEFGLYTIYQSWLNILSIFVTLNLYGGVFNNAMMKYEKDREGYISSMQGLVLCLCSIFFLVYFFTRNFWNNILGLPTVLLLIMFIQMAIQPAMEFWSGKQRYEYKYKKFVAITLLLAVVNPVIGILAVEVSNEKGYARVLSNAIVIIGISGTIYIYNYIKGKKFFDKEYWKYALSFNIPLIPYYLSQMIFGQSDRIMIDKMVGRGKAGIYGVALNCSTVLTFVLSAIEASYIPWLYKKIREKEFRSISKVGNELLLLVGVALMCVILLGPEIIWLMGPSEYQEAIWVIPPLAGGLLFLFESKLFVGVEFYYENKRGLVYASFMSAIVNIALNFILIPIFGFIAAGYTTLISYILFAIGNYLCMQKEIARQIEENKPIIYDGKFLIFFSVLFLSVSFLVMMLYPYRWIRLAIMVAMIIVILINYKKIWNKIRCLKVV